MHQLARKCDRCLLGKQGRVVSCGKLVQGLQVLRFPCWMERVGPGVLKGFGAY